MHEVTKTAMHLYDDIAYEYRRKPYAYEDTFFTEVNAIQLDWAMSRKRARIDFGEDAFKAFCNLAVKQEAEELTAALQRYFVAKELNEEEAEYLDSGNTQAGRFDYGRDQRKNGP